jgi:hypothetical protein
MKNRVESYDLTTKEMCTLVYTDWLKSVNYKQEGMVTVHIDTLTQGGMLDNRTTGFRITVTHDE